jgi:hypothetical protein
MTEFALVFPVLFLLLLGTLDGGLLLFSVGSARYAAGEGSRVAATLGNDDTTDDQVVRAVRDTVSQTSLFQVDEVDIYKLDQDGGGNLTPNPTFFNRYRLDGTPLGPPPWPPSARNVSSRSGDFLGVSVNYTYQWKAGFFSPLGPVRQTATYYIRLEPQSY